ncbi:C-type mannose receptor 2-like isoform X1, partial [Clarias magur]
VVLSVPRKYYLVQQGMNWNDAQAYCKAKHTDLAIVESDDNMVHLQYETQRQKFTSSAWIGMYNDVNSWRWSMGNVPLGSFTAWYKGLPDIKGVKKACGVRGNYGWFDVICTQTLPFFCFD